jgi:hypothetical protein
VIWNGPEELRVYYSEMSWLAVQSVFYVFYSPHDNRHEVTSQDIQDILRALLSISKVYKDKPQLSLWQVRTTRINFKINL